MSKMKYQLKSEEGYEYIEEGNGPILLLLHGLFGALSNWATVVEYFKQNYTVVIPLLPLYTLPLKNTNVDGLSEFVHQFVTFKGYEKVNLLGNSLGGHVALVYTIDYPEKVSSMILTGSSGLYENSFGGGYPKRNDYNFIKQRTSETFYDPETATDELVDEVFEIVNNREKGLRIVTMAKSAIKHNLRKEMPGIKVNSCLIWGRNDTITPPEVAEDFKNLLPNSELYWIDKCGHAPMMERPEEFNTILDKFLKSLLVEEKN